MRELSLFSGAGGGLLGTKLLGWTHIGYVENNEYCQRVIAQRIEDGLLDRAPIFGDIKAFISEGYAESYKGMVDVITAGFVCTEISIANQKAKGMEEGISIDTWEATAECIRIIRPKKVLLENSPEILNRGFERVANDLAEMGYSFKWCVLGCDDVGGIHRRKRWWCVATDSLCERDERQITTRSISKIRQRRESSQKNLLNESRHPFRDTSGYGSPLIRGKDDDVDSWLDRIKSVGNGQIPFVVKAAWQLLND